jgi:hypothetical protein
MDIAVSFPKIMFFYSHESFNYLIKGVAIVCVVRLYVNLFVKVKSQIYLLWWMFCYFVHCLSYSKWSVKHKVKCEKKNYRMLNVKQKCIVWNVEHNRKVSIGYKTWNIVQFVSQEMES